MIEKIDPIVMKPKMMTASVWTEQQPMRLVTTLWRMGRARKVSEAEIKEWVQQ